MLDALNPEWSDFGEQDLIAGYEVAAAAFVAFVMGALLTVAIKQALVMSDDERQTRMRALRRRARTSRSTATTT